MLRYDSTSSKEMEFTSFLAERLLDDTCTLEKIDVGDGTENLLFSWGQPEIVFCSHLDTVPPYISPKVEVLGEDVKYCGRGTCDAKGQIFAMYSACKMLYEQGNTNFGLLLLAGEETGSYGAKSFRDKHQGGKYVIVGEPTDNCMVSACKGTKSFEITLSGIPFHSGYPQYGESAIMYFNDFINVLKAFEFPQDDILGETTWNVGKLESNNPQNIISSKVTFRLYFRTTFTSDTLVTDFMANVCGDNPKYKFGGNVAMWQKRMSVKAFGGDTPMKFTTLEGFPTKTVSFGSDAPQLTNFENKILCGPGSILVAHRNDEHIMQSDIEIAINNYIEIYKKLTE